MGAVRVVTAEVEARVIQVEREIVKSKVEIQVVFDPETGIEVDRKTGGPVSVPASLRTGAIFTHNHPPIRGRLYNPVLSRDDAVAGMTRNALQIRAVGRWYPSGRPYVSIMTRAAVQTTWPQVLGLIEHPFYKELFEFYLKYYRLEAVWKKLLPLAGESFPNHITYSAKYV